jgi:hypothetical protein
VFRFRHGGGKITADKMSLNLGKITADKMTLNLGKMTADKNEP